MLSEIPERWVAAVDTLAAADEDAPDVRERWTILQLALSIWPVDATGAPQDGDDELRDRVIGAMRKSMREAKTHTDWLDPNEDHERAVEDFVRAELRRGTACWRALEGLAPDVAWHGALASLSQVVLKVASPGVPDIYRGTELWDLNLVDPDNRRPYDQELRTRLVRELADVDDPAPLFASWPDGRVKFLTLLRTLDARRSRPEVFVGGTYEPLAVTGPCADHVVAFARRSGGDVAVAVVPRATVALSPTGAIPSAEIWTGTEVRLPSDVTGTLLDRLTRRPIEIRGGSLGTHAVLGTFPVALLTSWR